MMLEVCLALLLLAAGFWAGRKSAPSRPTPPETPPRELQKLREDRAAFTQLMGYNAERAYGNGEE